MGHAVAVDVDRWNRALKERGLPPAKGKFAGHGRVVLTRKDVLELGDLIPNAENSLQLLYHSLAWGLGTRAPRLQKRLGGLASDVERAQNLLLDAWQLVRSDASPRESYRALTTERGAGRIPWLGPAFATKFLYFAQGYSREPCHLILDAVVATNLRDVWPQAPTTAWWPETYETYCRLVERWVEQAGLRVGQSRSIRADEIELALFRRHLSRTTPYRNE
ncbi:hypothetical protein AB4Y77_11180 [Paenarthrobacter sp. YAF11_1]|uniref:8-oxoguanine DNA glycosylase OGG fold protein n=1 Tax=Paenarthrobacter sp. YAF11_1 TaxID=3233074 RepID=UPI003F970C28